MANVSEERMRDYLEGFHAEYRRAAESQVPADLRRHLERYPHLASGIIGYVSTQFGAGYEYDNSRPGKIAIIRGSARVEDLFWKAPAPLRRGMTFILAGQNTSVHGSGFRGGYPVRLASINSSVRLVDVSADAAGWSRHVSYAELLGDRSAGNWSSEQAVRRALSEILQAVVDLRQLEDRNLSLEAFLNRFRQQKVLLLGDFNKGRDRLLALREELERRGYLGVLADEIPDIRELDLRQKIQLLSLACRFVVIEDSTPAGQLTEAALVETTRQVTVVLRRAGMAASWMTAGLSNTSAVIKESEYDDGSLSAVVGDAVAWAEQRLHELGRKLDELYPWRKDEM